MNKLISRRFFLAALSSTATVACAKAPETSLRPEPRGEAPRPATPRQIVSDAELTGITSYLVAEVATGRRIEALNETALLAPASVAKAITGLYALDVLGADYRFATNIRITGPIQNGIVQGDLILQGSGDPLMNTDDYAALVAKVAAKGITGVRGRFIVDGSALKELSFVDASQPDHVGYNPSISGLNLNFNRVHFEWKKNGDGFSTTMDARSENLRPVVRSSRMQIVGRESPVYEYKDVGTYDAWTVSRGALNAHGSRWLPTRKPRAHVAEVFAVLARSNGITLPAAQFSKTTGGEIVAQHQSPKLSVLVRSMLKFSTNLTAEVLGLTATRVSTGRKTNLVKSARAMNTWASKTYGASFKMVDHSGLGDKSRVTSAGLVQVLIDAKRRGIGLDGLLKTIPMRDAKNKVIQGHSTQVVAKTGTLNFVSGLAGYVTGRDGRMKAFAIVSADLPRRAKISKANRDNPSGAKGWSRRSRRMQQRLLQRWGNL